MALLLMVGPAEESGSAIFPPGGKCHTPFPSVAIHSSPPGPSAISLTIISGIGSNRLNTLLQTVNTPESFPINRSPPELAKMELHCVNHEATGDSRPVLISYLYKP